MNLSTAKITKLLHVTSIAFLAIFISSAIYIVFKGLDSLSSATFLIFIYLFGITLGTAGKVKEQQENIDKILLEWFIACMVGIILLVMVLLFS
ncbi:MAG: hypothetical protein B6U95_05760 [Thermofilum sp. ex4484_82]|nr:MAG: hypothetical protein B6U95_05760 [Thermofilum sp. ex4484_82]OYT37803.1 MAG: hypothetical protein B6U96_05755 [Archaeoglobales archaeon ex4484_92]